MKNGATFRQNVEWLLDYYKKDLEEVKASEENHTINVYDKDQLVWDLENVIMELEALLKFSR